MSKLSNIPHPHVSRNSSSNGRNIAKKVFLGSVFFFGISIFVLWLLERQRSTKYETISNATPDDIPDPRIS